MQALTNAARAAASVGRGALRPSVGAALRPRLDWRRHARRLGVFLSDAHLGAESREREAHGKTRRSQLPRRAARAGVPPSLSSGTCSIFGSNTGPRIPPQGLLRTLAALQRLREAGSTIQYLTATTTSGSAIHAGDARHPHRTDQPVTIEQQGRRLWVHHRGRLVGRRPRLPESCAADRRSPFSIGLVPAAPPGRGFRSPRSRSSNWSPQLAADHLAAAARAACGAIAEPRLRGRLRRGVDCVGHFHTRTSGARYGREFFRARRLDRALHVTPSWRAASSRCATGPRRCTIAARARRVQELGAEREAVCVSPRSPASEGTVRRVTRVEPVTQPTPALTASRRRRPGRTPRRSDAPVSDSSSPPTRHDRRPARCRADVERAGVRPSPRPSARCHARPPCTSDRQATGAPMLPSKS